MTGNQEPARKIKNDNGVMRVPRASYHFLFSKSFPFCRHYTRNDAKTQGSGEIAAFPGNAKKCEAATLYEVKENNSKKSALRNVLTLIR